MRNSRLVHDHNISRDGGRWDNAALVMTDHPRSLFKFAPGEAVAAEMANHAGSFVWEGY
jgi:hypothetical protein